MFKHESESRPTSGPGPGLRVLPAQHPAHCTKLELVDGASGLLKNRPKPRTLLCILAWHGGASLAAADEIEPALACAVARASREPESRCTAKRHASCLAAWARATRNTLDLRGRRKIVLIVGTINWNAAISPPRKQHLGVHCARIQRVACDVAARGTKACCKFDSVHCIAEL